MITRSPLAHVVERPRDVTDRANPVPYGVCIHTTGSGVPTQAAKLGIDPLQVALDVYLAPDAPPRYTNFPHYVIGGDGTIMQIADERERARHAGITQEDRLRYQTTWWSSVSATGFALWQKRWPKLRNPLQLFPSRSPNEDFLGVELIPQLTRLSDGSLFTPEQYDVLARLLDDVQDRYGIKLSGSRLVGHEDLEPLARWNSGGGWDPGGLRANPTFLWDVLHARMGNGVG